jgi:hypothetical protein
MDNAQVLGELRQRTEEIAGWNRELEARVAAQLAEPASRVCLTARPSRSFAMIGFA